MAPAWSATLSWASVELSLGGFLASALLQMPNAVNGINVMSILVAFLGAVLLIAVLRAVSGRRRLV